jgi:hypothetical protein
MEKAGIPSEKEATKRIEMEKGRYSIRKRGTKGNRDGKGQVFHQKKRNQRE